MAGTVGGILANSTRPAEFIYDNMMIHATVVHAAHLFPREAAAVPRQLLHLPARVPAADEGGAPADGPLEPTNEAYAIAKIAGIKLCQAYRKQYGCDFISAMPTNLYGPNDNFDLASSHVLPALIRKFHDAKVEGRDEVAIWGTGSPRREFLHVDDLADACLFLMRRYDAAEHINVGTGEDLTIRELAEMVRDVVHPQARLVFDPTQARRHAAQAARRLAAARARLAPPHRARATASPRPTAGSSTTTTRPAAPRRARRPERPPRASRLMAVLVTGGAGYIGSAFVERAGRRRRARRRARRPVARAPRRGPPGGRLLRGPHRRPRARRPDRARAPARRLRPLRRLRLRRRVGERARPLLRQQLHPGAAAVRDAAGGRREAGGVLLDLRHLRRPDGGADRGEPPAVADQPLRLVEALRGAAARELRPRPRPALRGAALLQRRRRHRRAAASTTSPRRT